MTAALALALALLLTAPGLAVDVDGDPAFASFVAARLLAEGHTLAPEHEAVLRVRIVPVVPVEQADHERQPRDAGARVVVEDTLGPLVERTVEAADEGERRLAAWLVVQGAVARTGGQQADVVASAPPPARRDFSLGAALAASPDIPLAGGARACARLS